MRTRLRPVVENALATMPAKFLSSDMLKAVGIRPTRLNQLIVNQLLEGMGCARAHAADGRWYLRPWADYVEATSMVRAI